MVEEWPKVVGLLIGVSVLGALVWVVRWWQEQNAKARERARIWAERLAATDDHYLSECGITKDDRYVALALGLRRLIVEFYDPPPVNANDEVEVEHLSAESILFEDNFDP